MYHFNLWLYDTKITKNVKIFFDKNIKEKKAPITEPFGQPNNLKGDLNNRGRLSCGYNIICFLGCQ